MVVVSERLSPVDPATFLQQTPSQQRSVIGGISHNFPGEREQLEKLASLYRLSQILTLIEKAPNHLAIRWTKLQIEKDGPQLIDILESAKIGQTTIDANLLNKILQKFLFAQFNDYTLLQLGRQIDNETQRSFVDLWEQEMSYGVYCRSVRKANDFSHYTEDDVEFDLCEEGGSRVISLMSDLQRTWIKGVEPFSLGAYFARHDSLSVASSATDSFKAAINETARRLVELIELSPDAPDADILNLASQKPSRREMYALGFRVLEAKRELESPELPSAS